ncbi:helix-turn-helix domain-containing protein [Streptosporangium sp. NPDC049644]|uniref:GbsR/MarR family transcriptional regulator n=1 Tax=Streptosporangium sp. NPDC049644 TaxID=3155507 RepID=UPI003433C00C
MPEAELQDRKVFEVEEGAVEMAIGMGLPKMMARVLIGLWLSEDGKLTAAELSRGLKVSPASISMAVGYLTQQGLIRRERDPQRWRDIYVVDDDAWYHSTVISSRRRRSRRRRGRRSGSTRPWDAAWPGAVRSWSGSAWTLWRRPNAARPPAVITPPGLRPGFQ